MSETLASPSWLSRNRDTASYSYRPCCALVVDLMCQVRSGAPIALATSSASTVLPVPGSPLISSGRSSTIEGLTAILRSSVVTYFLVPVNLIEYLPCCLFLCAGRASAESENDRWIGGCSGIKRLVRRV